MNSVELIKKICKERKIPISKLERDLNYGNGYIGQLKKGTIPSDRAIEIANYLKLDLQYLLSGENESKKESPNINSKDERDIQKKLSRIMNDIKNKEDSPLYYNGEEIDDTSLELLEAALNDAMHQMKIINKERFNPKKNKV